MKALYGSLFGIVLVLMVAPLAAGERAFSSWDRQINTPGRFKVLDDFADAAVLDKETGLVWKQSPSTSTVTWFAALLCYSLEVGGRKGWRLPTIEELASLVDTSVAGSPKLPAGHPFSNVQSSVYWSATTEAGATSSAWIVFFDSGGVGVSGKGNTNHVWCVRGGQGVDGVQAPPP